MPLPKTWLQRLATLEPCVQMQTHHCLDRYLVANELPPMWLRVVLSILKTLGQVFQFLIPQIMGTRTLGPQPPRPSSHPPHVVAELATAPIHHSALFLGGDNPAVKFTPREEVSLKRVMSKDGRMGGSLPQTRAGAGVDVQIQVLPLPCQCPAALGLGFPRYPVHYHPCHKLALTSWVPCTSSL